MHPNQTSVRLDMFIEAQITHTLKSGEFNRNLLSLEGYCGDSECVSRYYQRFRTVSGPLTDLSRKREARRLSFVESRAPQLLRNRVSVCGSNCVQCVAVTILC